MEKTYTHKIGGENMKTKLQFKVGDQVEWFDGKYSSIKNYGTIIRLTPKHAEVRDTDAYEGLVKLTELNWS